MKLPNRLFWVKQIREHNAAKDFVELAIREWKKKVEVAFAEVELPKSQKTGIHFKCIVLIAEKFLRQKYTIGMEKRFGIDVK